MLYINYMLWHIITNSTEFFGGRRKGSLPYISNRSDAEFNPCKGEIMIEKFCESCGKPFYVRPSRKEKSRFCSTRCWTQSEESKKIVSETQRIRHKLNPIKKENNKNYIGFKTTCEFCGNIFESFRSRERKYCSYSCASKDLKGEKCGAWKGGVSPRTSNTKWYKIRDSVWGRDLYKCVYCGSNHRIVAHHIKPYRYGGKDEIDNLETVCGHCHPLIEKYHTEIMYENAIILKCYDCKKCLSGIMESCPLSPVYKGLIEFLSNKATLLQNDPVEWAYREKYCLDEMVAINKQGRH